MTALATGAGPAGAGPVGVWHWWCRSMAGWLPARLRARLAAAQQRLLLQATADGQLQLWLERDGQLDAVGTIAPPASAAQFEAALAPAARALPCWWLLPPGQVLQRPLRLPAATLPRLHAVVGFEIDRQTPFAADQVSHDVRLLEQGGEQLRAELVVLPRNVLEQALAAAAGLSARLAGIDAADAAGRPLGVNLLPPAQRLRRRNTRWLPALAVAVLGMVLLGLAGERILLNRAEAVATLQAEVQAQARQAREVAGQRQQLQALVDGARFFQQQRDARPTTVEVWEELSQRLPDGTVLEKLSIEGDQLQLIGLSDQASALVGLLDGSALWHRPALSGVLQAEAGQRRDRFTLGATLAGGHPAAAAETEVGNAR